MAHAGRRKRDSNLKVRRGPRPTRTGPPPRGGRRVRRKRPTFTTNRKRKR